MQPRDFPRNRLSIRVLVLAMVALFHGLLLYVLIDMPVNGDDRAEPALQVMLLSSSTRPADTEDRALPGLRLIVPPVMPLQIPVLVVQETARQRRTTPIRATPAAVAIWSPTRLNEQISANPCGSCVQDWVANLRGRFWSAMHDPHLMRPDGWSATTTLRVTIDRLGNVLDVVIAIPSGTERVDSEALAAAKRASPVPRPPPELVGTPITLDVPVRYRVTYADEVER